MLVCQMLGYLNEEAKSGFNIRINNIYGNNCYLVLDGLQVLECFVEVCGELFQIRGFTAKSWPNGLYIHYNAF